MKPARGGSLPHETLFYVPLPCLMAAAMIGGAQIVVSDAKRGGAEKRRRRGERRSSREAPWCWMETQVASASALMRRGGTGAGPLRQSPGLV